MGVSYGEVLAEDFDVVNRLTCIVVNMLLDRQDRFILICIFEFFWQFAHNEVLIFVLEVEKLEFKVNVGVWTALIILFLSIALLLVDYTLWHLAFGHALFIHFLEQF